MTNSHDFGLTRVIGNFDDFLPSGDLHRVTHTTTRKVLGQSMAVSSSESWDLILVGLLAHHLTTIKVIAVGAFA